jgi:transposase
MEVIHERCAGLDVHKGTVVGCLRVRERGQVRREVRRWATTTAELLELGDWLRQAGCTHVAMEATGVYWKPVWHVLEGEFELILANPAHIRNVPGAGPMRDQHDKIHFRVQRPGRAFDHQSLVGKAHRPSSWGRWQHGPLITRPPATHPRCSLEPGIR